MFAVSIKAHHALICEQHLWYCGVNRSGPVMVPSKGTSKVIQHGTIVSSSTCMTVNISVTLDVA